MASSFPGTLDSFATNRVDATVMATNQAADHNNYADAIAKIETKVGTGASTPVANSLFGSTGSGVSAWSTVPTVVGMRSATTSDSLYFDNQGLYPSNTLTNSRINIRRAETGVRSGYVFGESIHIQARQASTLGERLIGHQVYIEDASVTDVAITGAVNNGSGLIRLTATAHGYATGTKVLVWDVGGVTNANSIWTITSIDANTVDLQGSTFAGTYTSGGTMSNRPCFYGYQVIVAPDVERGTGAGTINYDDIAAFAAYNAGNVKATDAVYIDGNPSISGSKWGCLFSGNTDADAGLWLGGDAYPLGAIRITSSEPIILGSPTAQTGIFRMPNNTAFVARNAGNTADVTIIKANASNRVEVGTTLDVASGTEAIRLSGTYSTYGIDLKFGTYTTASVRLKNDSPVSGRNAADGADVNLFRINSLNEFQIDSPFRINGQVAVANNVNIGFSATNGTKLGTATSQKIGFWNVTPVIQPTAVTDATGGATVDAEARTALNALLARMRTVGLISA